MDPQELHALVGYSVLALTSMLDDKPDNAEKFLRQIPRVHRGNLKIALDDLDQMLSRLGNNA